MEEKKKSSNWVVFAFLIGVVVLMILVKLLFF
jgi:RsiW-degrading membrane proteinase PrsW (M82 family)